MAWSSQLPRPEVHGLRQRKNSHRVRVAYSSCSLHCGGFCRWRPGTGRRIMCHALIQIHCWVTCLPIPYQFHLLGRKFCRLSILYRFSDAVKCPTIAGMTLAIDNISELLWKKFGSVGELLKTTIEINGEWYGENCAARSRILWYLSETHTQDHVCSSFRIYVYQVLCL